MKKITLLILTLVAITAMILTSCSAKKVTVRVIDADGTIVCEQVVELGAKNPNSIKGENYYALDCLEDALTKSGIEYNIAKDDIESYAITNIGKIAADTKHQFTYYRQDNAKSELVDKTGLTAQHDEMEGGEILIFKYEEIKTEDTKAKK